jgi:hypothetical protein
MNNSKYTVIRFYILFPTDTEIGLPLHENNTYLFVIESKGLRTTFGPERGAVTGG